MYTATSADDVPITSHRRFTLTPCDRLISRAIATVLAAISSFAGAQVQEPDWHHGGELHISDSLDSDQNISLAQSLTLNIDPGRSVSLRGMLSGPDAGLHALIKKGAGRLELWGDNRGMEQPVALHEGTLHLAGRYALGQDWWANLYAHAGTTLSYAPGATVAALLHLHDDVSGTPGVGYNPAAVQWRVDSGIATQIGAIHGTTPLIKLGAGTLRLSEAAVHPDSHLTIAEGTVQLENQFSGLVNILGAGTLSGSGRTGWLSVDPGGTLAPTGRLTVDNLLQFLPGSQLRIRIWPDGQHDSVQVMHGAAGLNGHVLILPQGQPENWKHGIDAIIVQARDGLGPERFASVESALPYIESTLSYDSHHVTVHLRPRAGGLTASPRGVAAVWPASVRSMIQDDSRFIRAAIYAHGVTGNKFQNARNIAYGQFLNTGEAMHHRFWSQAFHSSGERRTQGQTSGDKRHISGLLLGADLNLTHAWRLGVYGGGSGTQATGNRVESDDAHPNAHIDSSHLGLYVHGTSALGSQLTAGAAQSWHRVRSSRTASTPLFRDTLNSRYRAHSTQVFTKIRYPLWVSHDLTTAITPFARLAWVQTRQNKHTESGGPLAMHMLSERTAVLFSSIGLGAHHHLQLPQSAVTLTGTVAWRHASGDTHSPMRQYFRDDAHRTVRKVRGVPVARRTWQLRLGVQADIGKHAQLGVHYAGQHGRRNQDHGVQMALNVRW